MLPLLPLHAYCNQELMWAESETFSTFHSYRSLHPAIMSTSMQRKIVVADQLLYLFVIAMLLREHALLQMVDHIVQRFSLLPMDSPLAALLFQSWCSKL